ncbi:hypothetical protein EV215_0317 [Hypnocyclicus thermotrophus]|uniref:Uncharacterized protein n=1 Tax=Hypnocyclicus thermotrophus TaxID=1627895 RepID=A0AA46I6M7_9FUSO|nr:hypothetical protein [Hypnocyclicus thermotrophus]TDT72507.1 hypothetical protein EV215_0317 [Hypnocyclicus thermotrophus]
MKKTFKNFKDLQDIENFFLKEENNENKKQIKNTKEEKNENSKSIKALKKELNSVKYELEQIKKHLHNKKSDNENTEIAKMFIDFNVDEIYNEESKKQLEKLQNEIQQLKKENRKLKKEKENIGNTNKKYGYDSIYNKLKSKYNFLLDRSIVSLATAEYLYKNETNNKMDYSIIYINYIKTLEIELKRVYQYNNTKLTFGNIINRLEKNPLFKTFVYAINKQKVVQTRNIAIHKRVISKMECGKIRKLLIEDDWLSRIAYLLNEVDKENKMVKINMKIIEKKDIITINGKNYTHYITDGDIDIISLKTNLNGKLVGTGEIIEYQCEEYITY